MTLGGADRTGAGGQWLSEDIAHFHRDDAGRHGDDGVAENHDEGGQELTQTGRVIALKFS